MLDNAIEIQKLIEEEIQHQTKPIKEDVKTICISVEKIKQAVADMQTTFEVRAVVDKINWKRLNDTAITVMGNGNHDTSHDGRLKRIETILENQVVTKKGIAAWFEKPYVTIFTFAFLSFVINLISKGLIEYVIQSTQIVP